jgi:hypothetical protein
MTEIKFDEIWDIVVKPYLKRELSLDSSLQVLDVTENSSEARRDIESLYNTARNALKTDFMKDSKKLLDRHKVPACLYCAMTDAPLLKVFGGSVEKDRLANAKLAFYASASLLLSFMKSSADAEYAQFLKSSGIQFPQSKNLDSPESYIVQTIKGLCYAQKNKEINSKTNPIMLANIFCLLESNTDLAYKNIKK